MSRLNSSYLSEYSANDLLFSSDADTDGADTLSEQGYCTSVMLVKKQKNSQGSEAQKYSVLVRRLFNYGL